MTTRDDSPGGGGRTPAAPSWRLDDPSPADLRSAFQAAYGRMRVLPHIAAEYARDAAGHAMMLTPAGCGEWRGVSYVYGTGPDGRKVARVYAAPLRRVLGPALLGLATEGGAA